MIKKIIMTTIVLSSLVFAQAASAGPFRRATENLNNAVGDTGLESSLGVSIGVVVKGILSLVGTIFLVLTIYSGILWMTAQGNEQQVTKAKGIIQTAVIGLFVVLAAYAITDFITSRVGNANSTTPPPSGSTI